MIVTFRIPIDIPRLANPNVRAHWRAKHRANQEMKNTTIMAIRASGLLAIEQPTPPITLNYTVARAKGRQKLDDDNIKSSLKYLQDGIADEIVIDDRHITVGSVEQIRDPDGVGYIDVDIVSDRWH